MVKLTIDDVKIDFVMNVYESITKQIQQMDLKISILLSWCGVIAAVLGREVAILIAQRQMRYSTIILTVGVVVSLLVSGFYIFQVLKPRKGKIGEKSSFVGLLWSGDILNLGKESRGRIKNYLHALTDITNHKQIYEQFVTSIVLISTIQDSKNRNFLGGLIATVISFSLLVALMAIVEIKLPV
ncbi:MAG: hypothetical protein HZC28_11100 [Spirochaetes bacterium]|nr:hypothetical protein [Spirochaetota bacterium]